MKVKISLSASKVPASVVDNGDAKPPSLKELSAFMKRASAPELDAYMKTMREDLDYVAEYPHSEDAERAALVYSEFIDNNKSTPQMKNEALKALKRMKRTKATMKKQNL